MASLTAKELNQLSEETGLSKLAIQDWHRRFYHECPSGSFPKERYLQLYRSFYPRAKNPDAYAQMFFTTFDEDRDQALNFREFLRIVGITQGNDDKSKLEVAYKAYNRNHADTNLLRRHLLTAVQAIMDLIEDETSDENKRQTIVEWVMKSLNFDEKLEITKKDFLRRCRDNTNLADFLAFSSVPKPNCPDGDLRGKEKYKIAVQTGNESKKFPGMNANVYLIIHGEQAESETIHLQSSHTHKDLFEQGHTDIFTEFLPNLGEIQRVTLWHTGDKNQGWYVEDVLITNETLNQTIHFPVLRWLDEDEYDKLTKIELIPNQAPGYNQ